MPDFIVTVVRLWHGVDRDDVMRQVARVEEMHDRETLIMIAVTEPPEDVEFVPIHPNPEAN